MDFAQFNQWGQTLFIIGKVRDKSSFLPFFSLSNEINIERYHFLICDASQVITWFLYTINFIKRHNNKIKDY